MGRINAIRRELAKQEYGALMITSPANRTFATGFISSAGVLLITSRDAFFFTDSRYIEAAEAAISDAHVRLVTHEDPYHDQIKAALAESKINSIGFEDNAVTYSKYNEWVEKLEVGLVPAQKLITELRAVKSGADLENMKNAQRIAEKSFEETLPLINSDITERQLAAELVYRFQKNGADDKSFDPIVVSGSRSSMPHGVPGDEKISEGFLTIDFGVRLGAWCSDTTRTVCLGRPDDEMIRVYETVLEAQEAGIKTARAGVPGKDVDAAARSIIESAGYGEYFGHGFGHGLGIEVHEAPTASKSSEDILQDGAVISAEPGIYLPGRFGVRIEDVIYIKGNGCENITNLPKKLIIL